MRRAQVQLYYSEYRHSGHKASNTGDAHHALESDQSSGPLLKRLRRSEAASSFNLQVRNAVSGHFICCSFMENSVHNFRSPGLVHAIYVAFVSHKDLFFLKRD